MTVRIPVDGQGSTVMKRDPLIRVRVLCNLLIEALDELDADGFSSPQLVDQLREVGNRAAEELDQLSPGRA